MVDICIIGAGASGMSAAITAKKLNPNLDIVILEKKEAPGKKILASGNGKCNMSNVNCQNHEKILGFFSQLGVLTRNDGEGRIYPYTEQSKVVVDALTGAIKDQGIKIITDCQVTSIEKDGNFTVKTEKGKDINAKAVLIACGGKAAPKLGTTGDGYKWAKALGHSVTKVLPALTAIDVKEDTKAFAGIRAKAKASLYYKGEEIFQESGEIQFTKDGLSGICIFNMSRFLLVPEGKTIKDGFDDYEISIDFIPGREDVKNMIIDRIENLGLSGVNALRSLVREPIAEYIYEKAGDNIEELTKALHRFVLHPSGAKGWDFAQVTKGGVSLDEINMETMESLKCSGLFFAGEVIDFDGPCGGYNLENAWETGIKAGRKLGNV